MFLLIVGGFLAYQFYTLYEALLSVINSAGFSLFFGEYAAINNNLGYHLLNSLGLMSLNSSQSPDAALTTAEIFLAITAVLAVIGLILTIVGAATKKRAS